MAASLWTTAGVEYYCSSHAYTDGRAEARVLSTATPQEPDHLQWRSGRALGQLRETQNITTTVFVCSTSCFGGPRRVRTVESINNTCRAIEALERIGTSNAIALLDKLKLGFATSSHKCAACLGALLCEIRPDHLA